MGYGNFAYYYDALNSEADYDRLCAELHRRLLARGIASGLVADLGCGTGEVSLRLAALGYDMIAVDASVEMLSVLREKMAEEERQDILLLCQALEELDLFGTIRAAVCTFDTVNHLPPKAASEMLRRVSLFLEPGGLFLFDANTPYKHSAVLANETFDIEGEGGLLCHWQNQSRDDGKATEIDLVISCEGQTLAQEHFWEYSYPLSFWEEKLAEAGMKLPESTDGESFSALSPESLRYFMVAEKL